MARTREFDTEATLDRCLGLFWARGFAGVSMSDLEAETGLGRQSLYTAFGNKDALFATVLERYSALVEALIAPMLAPTAGLADIRAYARQVVTLQSKHKCYGCLLVKTLWDRGLDDPDVQARAKQAAKRVRSALHHALQRAAARGEIAPGDNHKRADLFFAALNGLAALRRADVSQSAALDTLAQLLDHWGG